MVGTGLPYFTADEMHGEENPKTWNVWEELVSKKEEKE